MGDFILWIMKRWAEFSCLHEYRVNKFGLMGGLPFEECNKCGKIKR